MISCYIVDDETHAIETLISYIEKAPGTELSGSSTDPLEALGIIGNSKHPDITFLDVDMPQLSGIDLAGLINDKTAIVFTTAYAGHALEAFEKNASDYLLKPISFERFLACLKKLSKKLPGQKETMNGSHIYIKTTIKGKVTRITFDEILYVEAFKNYQVIHTPTEEHTTYLTLKEFENVVPEKRFLRVHKSFIINTDLIKSITGTFILIEGNRQIPLGHTYRNSTLDYINSTLVKSSR